MYYQYLTLRNNIISNFFKDMNSEQLKAVLAINGPVLILAGAGSGKTTTIINRIANILKFGAGLDEQQVHNLTKQEWDFLRNYNHERDYGNPLSSKLVFCNIPKPWNLLAITFTNKAAQELKSRLVSKLGCEVAEKVNASTFHSACVKILRKDIDKIGYNKNFVIYDTDDSKKIISEIINSMNLDSKLFPVKSVMSQISFAKNALVSPENMLINQDLNNYKLSTIASIYSTYQNELFQCNALDFDDIIKFTVELFEKCPDVLKEYQNKFKYIMVDEYQDTNHAQFKLTSLLSQQHKNLCVVGDDDQSIYKFRGATIDNILNFEKNFENVLVIRLEQNYRSTKTILNAANAVISKNFERKDKSLWTNNQEGDKISVYAALNEYGEAQFIADTILNNIQNGMKYSDNAVLYRTNQHSNIIEQCLVKSGIPYKIVGGYKFYERREIKDIIAYLSVINNCNDNLRLKRIINEPKRGIGETTMKNVVEIAQKQGLSLFDVIDKSAEYKALAKKSNILTSFSALINDLIKMLDSIPLTDFISEVLNRTGYLRYIEMLGKIGKSKLDNIDQLIENIRRYEETSENPSLHGFLEEISLYADQDPEESEDGTQVLLMTLHSAKGLEFKNVMIVGMEEGMFPGNNVTYDYNDIEEERRLAYVGFTRARNKLHLIYSKERKFYNKTLIGHPSRFIDEIPGSLCDFSSQDYPSEVRAIDKYKSNIAINKAMAMKARKKIGIGFDPVQTTTEHNSQNFVKGSNVRHKVFGIGTIVNVTPVANDVFLEIKFEKVGNKKIMANFAGLKVCD